MSTCCEVPVPQLRESIPKIEEIEVFMAAYLFLLIAVVSRLALAATPHPEWFNFTFSLPKSIRSFECMDLRDPA